MHSLDLILTLTGGLGAALVAGYLTHRLGWSPIVGYLVAGVVVGPHTPWFVVDQPLAEALAEVGVILLMFGVGLQFHAEDLLAVRRVALPGAVVTSAIATGLGTLVGLALGWTWSAGLVFGMTVSIASTVVMVRVLSDNRQLHTPAGNIAIGWLVVEDVLVVMLLVLMPVVFGAQTAPTRLAATVAIALVKVAALGVFAVYAGGRLIPWLLHHIAATRSRELFTLSVLVLALGIAVGSATWFGVSMPLGAFLAGLVVGRSDFSVRAASDALPMRDAFAVLFFVSVGMLFDPLQMLNAPLQVTGALAIILLGKPLAAFAITRTLGYPLKVALTVAAALSHIGEFSFIMAGVALDLGLLTPEITSTVIAASIISISLNPLWFRMIDPLHRWIVGRHVIQAPAPVDDAEVGRLSSEQHLAVVIGYGPVGRTVSRLLRENNVSPTIVELNMDTVRELRATGMPAIYGDASHPSTIELAGVARARSVILSVAGMSGAEETIRMVRAANPQVQILARTDHIRGEAALRRAGADVVFSGEAEVAFALTGEILANLGATPEQIDRERERVHSDLASSS